VENGNNVSLPGALGHLGGPEVGQWPSAWANGRVPKSLESLGFVLELFRRPHDHETILAPTKPFSAFGAEFRKPLMVIKRQTNTGGQRRTGKSGDSQMRTVSFVLAFAFVIAGSSMAGSVGNGLPGVGTFSYNGSPIAPSQTLVVAAR
jgi:hypothetical protein